MTENDPKQEMSTEDLERELERRKGTEKSAWVKAKAKIIGWLVVLVGGGGGYVDSCLNDERGEEIAIHQQAQLGAMWRKINENENRSRDNAKDLQWISRLGSMDHMMVEMEVSSDVEEGPDAGTAPPLDELFGDEGGAPSSTVVEEAPPPPPPAPRPKTYKPSDEELKEARQQIQQMAF